MHCYLYYQTYFFKLVYKVAGYLSIQNSVVTIHITTFNSKNCRIFPTDIYVFRMILNIATIYLKSINPLAFINGDTVCCL